jgi:stage V sporulation protein AD
LELGVLRSPVSQWTATGVGCSVLSSSKAGCYASVTKATMGRVIDYGIMDLNNMGAAMAPAAMDTLVNHLKNTNTSPKDYDLIVTGDLGKLGKTILIELMGKKGYDISDNCADCGASLYYDDQKTYMGASGAACSAVVFNSQLLNSFEKGTLNKLLLIGTGALMSPTTSFQGESIPCIAHLVEVRRCL